jgi:putative PIN family toxin of toxin-antitoxin system
MSLRLRVVLDTNALISRLLVPSSVPARTVRRAISEHVVLASDPTITELADVLSRRKFDLYVSVQDRKAFLRLFGRISERVTIAHVVRACRDPKDDKFLELAVNGAADVIVTGDADLLTLNPFRGIRIVSAAEFLLEEFVGGRSSDDPAGN